MYFRSVFFSFIFCFHGFGTTLCIMAEMQPWPSVGYYSIVWMVNWLKKKDQCFKLSCSCILVAVISYISPGFFHFPIERWELMLLGEAGL